MIRNLLSSVCSFIGSEDGSLRIASTVGGGGGGGNPAYSLTFEAVTQPFIGASLNRLRHGSTLLGRCLGCLTRVF